MFTMMKRKDFLKLKIKKIISKFNLMMKKFAFTC